jgi:hypothetical protein
MITSIVGLIASLLSIVLGPLVWTSHGQFISQQTQLQAIAVAGRLSHEPFLLFITWDVVRL